MSDHAIQEFRVHTISIPGKAVHSHGSGDVGIVRSVILEVVTDTGITGWGEASPWPVFTGTAQANATALHIHLKPHLVGQDPVQVEKLLCLSNKILVGHNEAKCALETALMDITGQISGLSIAELVGGLQRDEIPMSFSVANPDFHKDLEDIEKLWDDGVRLFKLKTGFSEHRFDVMRLEKLRNLYGDDISLRIDYNQGLAAFDAIRRIRDLEAFQPTFVEQPVKMHERMALAEITRSIDTPIMADESVFDPQQAFYAAHERIADIFSLKIMKSGGIRRALEVAAIARAAGIEIYGGCMFETGIAHAAGSHLMATVDDLVLGCEFYMATYYLQEDILCEPFPVHNGSVHVPQQPGLGVSVDTSKLEKYRDQLLD